MKCCKLFVSQAEKLGIFFLSVNFLKSILIYIVGGDIRNFLTLRRCSKTLERKKKELTEELSHGKKAYEQ